MIELQHSDYHLVEFLFQDKKQYIPALSVIHGNFPGRVFVNEVEAPQFAVVWAIGRWMYVEGAIRNEEDKTQLRKFIQNVVLPDCHQRKASWFEIYTKDADDWDDLVLEKMNDVKGSKHYESVYALNVEKYHRYKKSSTYTSEDTTLQLKDYKILPEIYHQFPYVEEKFKTKTCLGAELIKGDHLITICRNNGFVHKNEYFIDVDTFQKEERKKGYAMLAATHLIDHYLKSEMYPLWETTHDNLPSHQLAMKLGFEPVESYPVYTFVMDGERTY